jgi:hypothetical protein
MPRFTPTIQSRTAYNVESPTQIGLYPALARMVMRGDVQEAEVVSTRKVNIASLADGTLPFSETVEQDGDVKGIGGDVPPAALAVGRAVVEFTGKLETTEPFDVSKYTRNGVIQSATGQLAWQADGKDKGFFVLNSDATKAVVGFAPDAPCKLGDVSIKVDNPFAVVFLTVMDEQGTIATADRLLLTVVARAKNTGMRYNEDCTKLLSVGEAPILLEPVKARIDLGRKGRAAVNILDHDGRSTGRSLPVKDGIFEINGARDKALYYEVVFAGE